MHRVLEPLRVRARIWGRNLASGFGALMLATAGAAFLAAAGFGLLVRAMGPIAACGLVGVVLLVLAGLTLALRTFRRQQEVEVAVAEAVADPFRQMVFDLSVMAGEAISARRRRG